MLQWGRTHLSAETFLAPPRPIAFQDASMGPHSSECGNRRAQAHKARRPTASMGPHSSECGNAPRGAGAGLHAAASMGPHSSECGNHSQTSTAATAVTTLQWGRTHLSAETGISLYCLLQVPVASMGPHSSECGNTSICADVRPPALLQWGRTHLSAETSPMTRSSRSSVQLQWGRTHLSAETYLRYATCSPQRRLQWGRTHLSAETRFCHYKKDGKLYASMGPHSSECGNVSGGEQEPA